MGKMVKIVNENLYRPKISIITVSYNAIATIEQTILSVVNQTYNNIEYIIIDGGSTDGTVEIIKKYEDKVAYWVSEPDEGIYDAMNKGIDCCHGDYVQILGADDILINKNIIEWVSKKLNDEFGIFSFSVWQLNYKYGIEKIYSNYLIEKDLLNGLMPPHQGIFARLEVMKKYYFNVDNKVISDTEFLYNCALSGVKFCFINEPIVFYSLSGMSGCNRNIILKERKNMIIKYNIPKEKQSFFLNEGQSRIKKECKNIVKKFLIFTNLYKFIQLNYGGWKKHRCTWKFCKICNPINRRSKK